MNSKNLKSGKEIYSQKYKQELESQAEWLRRGAVTKVNSIYTLLRRNGIQPRTILELGCGTGAVIEGCKNKRLADDYYAVDYSKDAIDYLKLRLPEIHACQCDITSDDFSWGTPVDVVVLSHVIEHLEEPGAFLESIRRKLDFSWLIVEVPLEDLIIARLKSLVRDRTLNSAGHVQFFTRCSVRRLIRGCGLDIVDEHQYIPVLDAETIRFVTEKDNLPAWHRILKVVSGNLLPQYFAPIWKRLYYSHYACLVRG